MNLPNFITLIRILLVPLLVIFLIEGHDALALLTFALAGVSDGLDGFLARVRKQKTTIGAYLDPIADKLLLTTSYVTLAVLDILPARLAVLVVSRDVIIVAGIAILFFAGRPLEIKPTVASKITTFCQLITVCFFLGHRYLGGLLFLEESLVWLTAAMTVLSGVQYLAIGFRILGSPRENT